MFSCIKNKSFNFKILFFRLWVIVQYLNSLLRTSEEVFYGICFKEFCTTEITSNCIKFSTTKAVFQHWKEREFTWCKIWTVKEMQHDFNIAFTKILLNKNSDMRARIFVMKFSTPYEIMTLFQCVVQQNFQNINIIFTIQNRFQRYSMLMD